MNDVEKKATQLMAPRKLATKDTITPPIISPKWRDFPLKRKQAGEDDVRWIPWVRFVKYYEQVPDTLMPKEPK